MWALQVFKVSSVCLIAATSEAAAQEIQSDHSALMQSLLPMVVNINADVAPTPSSRQKSYPAADPDLSSSEQMRNIGSGWGSGFVLGAGGEIVTNYHVVKGAYKITVTFFDGMQLDARIVAADRMADIALLTVKPPHPLTAVQWDDSGTLRIGDPVMAIGNPFGIGLSVTGGIVSALTRDIGETPYDDYIQTDAPINHGNSGGPLFNIRGQVVGINTALISPTLGSVGVGFAIPATDARFIINHLQKFGSLHPGWLGVKMQQITQEIATALGMQMPRGSIVAAVVNPGPGGQAGIEVGDIVLAINGTAPSSNRALLRDIAETAPGTRISLTIERNGRTKEVAAEVADWPRQQWESLDAPIVPVKMEHVIPPDLGLSFGPLPSAQRVKLGLAPDMPGILITAVVPGTNAARRGLVAGDVILRVQDRLMWSPADYLPALDAVRAQHREFALILILPQTQTRPGPEWHALAIGP